MQKLLLALLTLLFTMAQAATITITVGPEGCDHKSVQAAIDAASPGDLIEVREGTYYENVDLNKPLILQGTDADERGVVLDAGGKGSAITISANGATVAGLVVTNSSCSGILVHSDDNIIFSVSAIDNEYCGIRLEGSRNNTVEDSNFSRNGAIGITLKDSEYNRILSNTANENADNGIELEESSENLIANNSISGSGNDGIELKGSKNNCILSNHATGNMDGLCLELSSDGNQISDNNFSYNNLTGIMLRESRDNMVEKNVAEENNEGICLEGSSNTTVRSNNASENAQHGIHLNCYSLENTLYANQLIGNAEYEAYDESGKNQWDDGAMGNLYGDFDEPGEGCIASNGICKAAYKIPGSSSVDRYPLAHLLL
jgi:parallel beta-helix repeat protein